MERTINDIGPLGLLISYSLFVLVIGFVASQKVTGTKDAVVSVIRMTVQLVLAGFVLEYVFKVNTLWLVTIIFLIMAFFAAHTVKDKAGVDMSGILPMVFLAMVASAGGVLVIFMVGISGQSPWYDARYLIPIAGMLLGNSMNQTALSLERFASDLSAGRDRAEAMLAMGATPFEASLPFMKKALRAAQLPYITNMSGMGIVFLPGMMVGQILSGTSPLVSVKYQIAIMAGIFVSVTFTVIMTLAMEHRFFFTKAYQLKDISGG